MSISPNLALAAIPALRLASESVRNAFNTGVQFASQLGDIPSSAKPKSIATGFDEAKAEVSTSRLDALLQPLQQFLKSIGTNDAVELQTDGQNQITIRGESSLKQAVEDWLTDNPEWTNAWHDAAQKFLAKSPSPPSSAYQRQDIKAAPSLRSEISAEAAQHWYRTS